MNKSELELKSKSNVWAISVLDELYRLDDLLWGLYYPNGKNCIAERQPSTILDWFTYHIEYILLDPNNNFVDSKSNIINIVGASKYKNEIISEYIDLDAIMRDVNLRLDYENAFEKVEFGGTLAAYLTCTIMRFDLYRLAILHKSNKYRDKIEDFLIACNLHNQCQSFINGNYEGYIEFDE